MSGIGLVLVATFPIAYAVPVDPVIFQVPVPQPFPGAPDSTANGIVHIVLMLGFFGRLDVSDLVCPGRPPTASSSRLLILGKTGVHRGITPLRVSHER